MMILSALGIIFVVDNHSGESLGFLTNLFPYNSYFMPMFVFISGFFFKPERTQDLLWYLKDKVRKLLKPYYVHNIILGGGVTLIVNYLFDFSWVGDFSIYNLVSIAFSWGTIFDITSASWFIVMLFSVVFLYACIHRIYGEHEFIKDSIFFVCLIVIGGISVYLSMQGYSKDIKFILLLKIGFYLQFYHFGFWYRKYVDGLAFKPLYVCSICILISIGIHVFYNNSQLTFNSTAFMQAFNSPFVGLPFITSVIGILFFLNLSKILTPSLGDNKIVNEISENTLLILTTHLIFFNIVNAVFYLLYLNHFIDGFNAEFFHKSAWYVYVKNPIYSWVFLFAGVFGPLLLKRTYLRKLLSI